MYVLKVVAPSKAETPVEDVTLYYGPYTEWSVVSAAKVKFHNSGRTATIVDLNTPL